MTVPEPLAPALKTDIRGTGHPPTLLPTRQQRQILQLLQHDDLLWEIAEDPAHCTVYNEKRGRDQCVSAAVVTTLERQGWIRKRPNTQPDRLDSWEITPQGRALRLPPKSRSRSGETSSYVPLSE